MPYDDTQIAELEKQVDDLLKSVDDVLKTHASPGAPESDFADQTGAGKDNHRDWKGKKNIKHDQQVADDKHKKGFGKARADDDSDISKSSEEIEELLKTLRKAKKAKDSKDDMSDEDDSDDGNGNGNGNGADDDEDDFDSPSNPSKTKKAAPVDESEALVIKGTRITKNQVGDAQFSLFKSLNEEVSLANIEIEKQKDAALMATLRKRADDEFGHVPGTTDQRAYMLKHMGRMPEELRKSFETVLKQSEALAKSKFDTVGFGGVGIENLRKNGASFETKVSEIQKRDNCTRTEALSKARHEDPDGFKAYQGNN
jgi:hypothetical protein